HRLVRGTHYLGNRDFLGSIVVHRQFQATRSFALAHVDGRVRLGLHDLDETFAHQFEDGDEGHSHAHAALFGFEEIHELHEARPLERGENIRHAHAHRQPYALHVMVGEHFGPHHHVAKRQHHFLHGDLRQRPRALAFAQLGIADPGVAVEARDAVDALGGGLEALVFLQAAHQVGARIDLLAGVRVYGAWQQHARLDLGEGGGHHQILTGELELHVGHEPDVFHVLPGDVGDRDVEDVEVLPPDHVQQQVERSLERVEEYLQRLRRDVQILGQLRDGLAIDDREWHFH